MYDVIIVGGSNAGLSAALVLGRSRRRVLVLDHEQPRNAPSAAVHSFLSRDGTPPAELRRIGREQLAPYDGVELRIGEATDATRIDGGFEVTVNGELRYTARKLLLATGVHDELPPIEGMAELWGTSVFHCPYCHGWEVRDQPLAVYGRGESGVELAQMLRGWSADLVLCSDGDAQLSDTQRDHLARIGVSVREERIVRLEAHNGALQRIVFAEGEPLERSGMFIRAPQRQRSTLPAALGCEVVGEGMLPHLLKVDVLGQTSVPGVYAAGDMATPMQQAITAASTGAFAAAALNRELNNEEFGADRVLG